MKKIEFCRGCKAPIVWIRTEGGKNMPCEAKKISIVTELGKVVSGFEPHWGHCPEREKFKSGDKAKSD